ncbi:MAG: polysaccharide biosynthesis/export family protein [Verrucomicrobiota bacterium]
MKARSRRRISEDALRSLPAVGLLALVTSCAHLPIKSTFDPRASPIDPRDIVFEDAEIDRGRVQPEMLRPPSEAYLLGPGDVLEIEVSEIEDTLSRTYIMPDGLVYFNLAGGVRAEGLTTAELTLKLQEVLAADYAKPIVNVTLVEVKSRRYWILGRVYAPGIYPLRQPTSLLEAISMAGGLFAARFSGRTEELADLGNSVLIRDGKILPIDFVELVREGDTSQNVFLRHNDFIYLPSAQSSRVLLLGAVQKPQAVSFRDSLSLVEAMAYGAGPLAAASLTKVVILRGSIKDPQVAIVDFKAILTGKETDLALQPGDIIWVPKDIWDKPEEYVDLILQDAVRTIAINEGANSVGSDQETVITIPAGGG